ncbi:MAG: hypothetical protein ABI321_20095 [Polyangia bacterium]
MIPVWFVYVGGFSLVLLGLMQMKVRPSEAGDSLYTKFVNVGTLWSLLCITVGAGLLAMALGYWAGPFDIMKPPPPPTSRRHHH